MAKRKKKKPAKSGGNEKTLREIAGILIASFGILIAIGLATTPPMLTRIVNVFRLLFGLGVYVTPLCLCLFGLYTIVRKRRIIMAVMHLFLGTMWLTALMHALRFRRDAGTCVDRSSLFDGGGIFSGIPACFLNNIIGPAGSVLALHALALVYLKIFTHVSYSALFEKLAIKAMPTLNRMGVFGRICTKAMGRRMAEMKKAMDENRRDRFEAMRQERERRSEERARRLVEEIQTYNQTGATDAAQQPENVVTEDVADTSSRINDVPFLLPDMSPIRNITPFVDDGTIKEDFDLDPDSAPAPDMESEPELIKPPRMNNSPAVSNTTPTPSTLTKPVQLGLREMEQDHDEILVTHNKPENKIAWKLPEPDEWLDPVDNTQKGKADMSLRERLDATLKSFNVPAYISDVVMGASITRLEVTLESGVKVSRVMSLASDIALCLAADSKQIRIEAPIPGKSAIGIEVPNRERGIVPMRKVFLSNEFMRNARGVLTFVLGEDIVGQPIWTNLVKMPHLLVSGSTNSGKSVCLNCLITSILARSYPEDVRFIMMDMKRVELTPYDGIPHLLTPVVTEAEVAAAALKWVCDEMDRRYKLFAEMGVRNIDGYNKLQENEREKLFRILVIVDELADLMMVATASMNVEMYICRIAQLARATGIHIILATQRPDVKVITGTIKNNIPTRIAFAVPTQIDSRTILDQKGAESLLGRGDMLYMPVDSTRLLRLQGAFVSENEVRQLVDFWRGQGQVDYPLRFKGPDANVNIDTSPHEAQFVSEDEENYTQAVELVVNSDQASISMIQRKLRIGYNRAARLVELMEERGVVGPYDGSRPREVLITKTGFEAREF